MIRQIKFIVAPTIYRLEVVVNDFLSKPENQNWYSDFKPHVFGHEEYVMVFDQQTLEI